MSGKPTYYLWKNGNSPEDTIEKQKEQLLKYGFRVTILNDGSINKDINNGMKALIRNHMNVADCVRGGIHQ